MAKLSCLALALAVAWCTAFTPPSITFSRPTVRPLVRIYQEKEDAAAEAVFVPPEQEGTPKEASLETVESLGRGAAKVRVLLYSFESFMLKKCILTCLTSSHCLLCYTGETR